MEINEGLTKLAAHILGFNRMCECGHDLGHHHEKGYCQTFPCSCEQFKFSSAPAEASPPPPPTMESEAGAVSLPSENEATASISPIAAGPGPRGRNPGATGLPRDGWGFNDLLTPTQDASTPPAGAGGRNPVREGPLTRNPGPPVLVSQLPASEPSPRHSEDLPPPAGAGGRNPAFDLPIAVAQAVKEHYTKDRNPAYTYSDWAIEEICDALKWRSKDLGIEARLAERKNDDSRAIECLKLAHRLLEYHDIMLNGYQTITEENPQ